MGFCFYGDENGRDEAFPPWGENLLLSFMQSAAKLPPRTCGTFRPEAGFHSMDGLTRYFIAAGVTESSVQVISP